MIKQLLNLITDRFYYSRVFLLNLRIIDNIFNKTFLCNDLKINSIKMSIILQDLSFYFVAFASILSSIRHYPSGSE